MNDDYKFPPIELLKKSNININQEELEESKKIIENTLASFEAPVEVTDIIPGNIVTRYYLKPFIGVTVKKVRNLIPELQYNLRSKKIEMETIGEKGVIALDIINEEGRALRLRECIEKSEKLSGIPIIIGKDFDGKIINEDLTKLPHLIIAGTTGTGKSNLLTAFVINILYSKSPSEVALVLIDTRKTNFYKFEEIPHLLTPVIYDAAKTTYILEELINEMYKRYELFGRYNVDNIDSYNKISDKKIKKIVVIIEDFYDLMLYTNGYIEEDVQRLSQMARAAGINIIISTQRPSTNVLTGVIKANMPARIAFLLPSKIDSRTVIDSIGAEKLLKNREILFTKIQNRKIIKVQTPYVTENEVDKVVDYIKKNTIEEKIKEQNDVNEKIKKDRIREYNNNERTIEIIKENMDNTMKVNSDKIEINGIKNEDITIKNVEENSEDKSIFSKWWFCFLSFIFFCIIISSIF